VVLVVLVHLLVEEASAEFEIMMLMQVAQWCSSCLCLFCSRRHRLSLR
jgi:hypothetical protein